VLVTVALATAGLGGVLYRATLFFAQPAAGGRAPASAVGEEERAQRRQMLMGALLGGAGAMSGGAGAAGAFELEANRQATYSDKARQLREAVDWYLFELRPLIYPKTNIDPKTCEMMGDKCPERSGLEAVYLLYAEPPGRAAGPVLSRPQSLLVTPLKTLATSSVFDPDLSDDLSDLDSAFEVTCSKLTKAARIGDLTQVRAQYDKGREQMNTYFTKVNAATGLPADSESYLTLMPADGDVLENEKYWIRRQQKWLVKKKVDATSKGSKVARFYAKSIFGDDAVSWDPRGDRVTDFMEPIGNGS